MQPWGLYVDILLHSLAASPDGIVWDHTQHAGKQKSCLEVKCSILSEKSLILDVFKNVLFCLKEENGVIQLSSAYSYFHKIHTEKHVTRLSWCDFVCSHP